MVKTIITARNFVQFAPSFFADISYFKKKLKPSEEDPNPTAYLIKSSGAYGDSMVTLFAYACLNNKSAEELLDFAEDMRISQDPEESLSLAVFHWFLKNMKDRTFPMCSFETDDEDHSFKRK